MPDDPRAAGAEPVDFDKCPVCHQDTSHIPLEIGPEGYAKEPRSGIDYINLATQSMVEAEDELTRLRAELADARAEAARLTTAAAVAGIVLEALWLAEHDGIALAPTTKDAINHAIGVVRAALGGGAPRREGESCRDR